MKKYALSFIFLLMMVLITACGVATPTAAPSTEALIEPAEPAATPVVTAAIPESGSSSNATQVTITLADNTIEASQTAFQVGVPYTFVITNAGRHAHNFNINPPVSVIGSLNTALDSALLTVPREQLAVGSSVTVEYTFPETAAGQNLEFSCLIKRHYEDGMLLPITVTN